MDDIENYDLKASNKIHIQFNNILYVIRMSFLCNRMSLVCRLYNLACHPYVSRMYLHVIRTSLVCTRMPSVCHSYVLVCPLYVTRMYSYVAFMSLVCTRMSSVCHSSVALPFRFCCLPNNSLSRMMSRQSQEFFVANLKIKPSKSLIHAIY